LTWLKISSGPGLGAHLFVKVPRPGDSEVTFFGLRVKLPPVTTSLTTQSRVNPVKCLAQGHNKSKLAGLSSH